MYNNTTYIFNMQNLIVIDYDQTAKIEKVMQFFQKALKLAFIGIIFGVYIYV